MAAAPIIYVSVGTLTNGRPAIVAPEVVTWWALFQRLVWLKLGVRIEIVQAKGAGSLSGGTHHLGDAFDWRTWKFLLSVILEIVRLAREAGAPATWYRQRAQGFDPHIHAVIDIGRITPATYQILAVKRRRRNGLGRGGNGGADDGPRPSQWRNYQQGILWMQAQIAAHESPGLPATGGTSKPPTPTPVPEEDTLSAAEVAEIKANQEAWALAVMRDTAVQVNRLQREGFLGKIVSSMAQQFWAFPVPRSVGGKVVTIAAIQEVADTKTAALQSLALDSANAEAIRQVDGGAVVIDYTRIDKAISDAIGATTVTTTTTLGGTK